MPASISLGGDEMSILIDVMTSVGVVDGRVTSSRKRSKCREGAVPVYKFCSNDGFVVTAKESGRIAEVLSQRNVSSREYLVKKYPKLKTNAEMLDFGKKLLTLWTTYNRVAAANDGYTIK